MQFKISVSLSGYDRPLHVLLVHCFVGGSTQCLCLVLTPTSPHFDDEHELQLLHAVQKLSVPVNILCAKYIFVHHNYLSIFTFGLEHFSISILLDVLFQAVNKLGLDCS